MYDLPDFVNVTPTAPTPAYRLCGERDRMAPGTIRAVLASPISDIIKIQHAPFSHHDTLRKCGCTWRADLRCWLVQPSQGNWTWLVCYLVAQGVVLDVGVRLLLERTAERLNMGMDRAA